MLSGECELQAAGVGNVDRNLRSVWVTCVPTEAEKPQGTGGQPGGSEAARWSPGTHLTTKRTCKGPVPPGGQRGAGGGPEWGGEDSVCTDIYLILTRLSSSPSAEQRLRYGNYIDLYKITIICDRLRQRLSNSNGCAYFVGFSWGLNRGAHIVLLLPRVDDGT